MDKGIININGDGTPYREPELIDRLKLLEEIEKATADKRCMNGRELEILIKSLPQHSTGAHVHIDIDEAFNAAVEAFKAQFHIVPCAECIHRPKLRLERRDTKVDVFVDPPLRNGGRLGDYTCPWLCQYAPEHNELPPGDFWCQKGEREEAKE